VTSSNTRFIRIESSGTAVIYILMFHYVIHSLVIPFTSGLSSCRHHHPCFCFNGLLSFWTNHHLFAIKPDVPEQVTACAAPRCQDLNLLSGHRNSSASSIGDSCTFHIIGGYQRHIIASNIQAVLLVSSLRAHWISPEVDKLDTREKGHMQIPPALPSQHIQYSHIISGVRKRRLCGEVCEVTSFVWHRRNICTSAPPARPLRTTGTNPRENETRKGCLSRVRDALLRNTVPRAVVALGGLLPPNDSGVCALVQVSYV